MSLRYIVRQIVVASAVVAVAWFGSRYIHKEKPPVPASAGVPSNDEQVRNSIISYLAQPKFTGKELAEQALGGAKLELYRIDTGAMFFSLPHRTEAEAQEFVTKRFLDASTVRKAKVDGRSLVIGGYSMVQTEDRWDLFVTKASNLRLDPEAVFHFPYSSVSYDLSARELSSFLQNRNVRGGMMAAETGNSVGGRPEVFANHGVFVATKGEPSLQRLVEKLLKDLPDDGSHREQRVQKLLDFVTNEIAYDFSVLNYDFELLQRPDETLMSRLGDCSNKTILFASLLEQIGERYLLAYMPGHICVAVPQGTYENANGLVVSWSGSPWLLAETTVPGFRIGHDRLRDQGQFSHLEFLQNCKQVDTIVSLKTGRRVLFH